MIIDFVFVSRAASFDNYADLFSLLWHPSVASQNLNNLIQDHVWHCSFISFRLALAQFCEARQPSCAASVPTSKAQLSWTESNLGEDWRLSSLLTAACLLACSLASRVQMMLARRRDIVGRAKLWRDRAKMLTFLAKACFYDKNENIFDLNNDERTSWWWWWRWFIIRFLHIFIEPTNFHLGRKWQQKRRQQLRLRRRRWQWTTKKPKNSINKVLTLKSDLNSWIKMKER